MSEADLADVDDEMDTKTYDTFSSPEGTSDEEDADEEKIAEIQKLLEASPYSYDLHVQLISMCRNLGDLNKLRVARESMSKLFPLTSELWLDWLTDEKTLAATPEDNEKLVDLFKRAVKDYTSVSIWLDYVQFSIGNIGETWVTSGVQTVRQTFEQAVTAVGIHVTQGCLIWEAYREFEKAYLHYLKEKDASEEELKEQADRMYNLFKRQLSIPLLDMSQTYTEFKKLFGDSERSDVAAIDYAYNKALQKMKKLQQYEENLFGSESPHYEQYRAYIEFEKKEGEPVRVQNLYERAIVENCLKDELWLDYTKYLDRVVRICDMSLLLYERAVRNCPWCVPLWVKYGRALERYEQPHPKIVGVFESALSMGFTKEEDFKNIWIGYLDYFRRRTRKEMDAENPVDFKDIVDILDRAVTQMNQYFWGTESQYAIAKYWIFFTAQYQKDVPAARQRWQDLIACGHKEEARVWLDYANFEKIYGDVSSYRKALLGALSHVSDWPETFVDLLLTFESEEGTLETFEKSEEKCESEMKIINEKRLKKMEESAYSMKKEEKRGSRSFKRQSQQYKRMEEMTYSMKKEDKRGWSRSSKRQPPQSKNARLENSNSEVPVQMDSEGFKIPPTPDKYLHASESRLENHSPNETTQGKKRAADESTHLPEPKKQKEESDEIHGASVKHDPSKDERTVFLSNLSYQIEDEQIREFCSPIGEIEEVRLVKDFKGRSKGYCYVVYKSELDAKKALEKDREKLDGRPVLVSPCEDKKNAPSAQSKLKFSTGLEKNKVFVKNVPFKMTEKELGDLFKEHGILKSVRVVTYRNGHSKGIAYVEYEDEASALNAVTKMDGAEVLDKVLSCAISNPPPRKVRNEFVGSSSRNASSSSSRVSSSAGEGSSGSRNPGSFPRAGSSLGPRGRGRTQLSLVPRAVTRSSVGSQNVPHSSLQNGQKSEDSLTETKPLSNSDFANMMKK